MPEVQGGRQGMGTRPVNPALAVSAEHKRAGSRSLTETAGPSCGRLGEPALSGRRLQGRRIERGTPAPFTEVKKMDDVESIGFPEEEEFPEEFSDEEEFPEEEEEE